MAESSGEDLLLAPEAEEADEEEDGGAPPLPALKRAMVVLATGTTSGCGAEKRDR